VPLPRQITHCVHRAAKLSRGSATPVFERLDLSHSLGRTTMPRRHADRCVLDSQTERNLSITSGGGANEVMRVITRPLGDPVVRHDMRPRRPEVIGGEVAADTHASGCG
jgi:hypothetical protein